MYAGNTGSSSARNMQFTDAARRLLADARTESDRLRHEYVGTEHIVLALARQADAAATLTHLGIDRERVRTVLEELLTPGHALATPDTARPYTSRTHQALAFAAASARTAGHAEVGVEYLLVGMLRERMNVGSQMLQHCGLTVEQAVAYAQQLDSE